MNTFQHAKFEVGLYLTISKITWMLRGLVLKCYLQSEKEFNSSLPNTNPSNGMDWDICTQINGFLSLCFYMEQTV